jgi:DnaJ like chaperone protein
MIGKIIAGVFGWMIAGPIGVLIGICIGHQFDRGLGSLINPISAEDQRRIGESFFITVFSLLGYLAKSDGRISKAEISQAEVLMSRMGLPPEQRREAIKLFQGGAQADFSMDQTMQAFVAICGRQNNLKRSLLNYLIALALADGELHKAEREALKKIAAYLGFSEALFSQFLEMIMAQARFRGSDSMQGSTNTVSQLEAAYKALGVSATQTDAQIKKAYRKLLSENHPDKLIGQGMPADMIKLATERTQEIRKAYELIMSTRK